MGLSGEGQQLCLCAVAVAAYIVACQCDSSISGSDEQMPGNKKQMMSDDDPWTLNERISVTFEESDQPLLLQLGGGVHSDFFANVLNFPKGPDGRPGAVQLCDLVCVDDGIVGVNDEFFPFGGRRIFVGETDEDFVYDDVKSYADVVQRIKDASWPKTLHFGRTPENAEKCARDKAERDERCAREGRSEKCLLDWNADNALFKPGTETPRRSDGTAGNTVEMKLEEWETQQAELLKAQQAKIIAQQQHDAQASREQLDKEQAEAILAE